MTTSEHRLWLLHKKPQGDNSFILTFFGQDGLLKAYFKGGRQPKTQGLLQPFIPLWASVNVRPTITFLQKLEQADSPLYLSGNMLFSGLYLNELLYHVLQPGVPFPDLYNTYDTTLKLLSLLTDKTDLEIALRRFEWALLASSGYGLCLDKDAHTGAAINPDKFYRFFSELGLIPSESGISGKDLLDFSAGDFSRATVLKTAKYIMRRAINALLEGKELKSRTLFN